MAPLAWAIMAFMAGKEIGKVPSRATPPPAPADDLGRTRAERMLPHLSLKGRSQLVTDLRDPIFSLNETAQKAIEVSLSNAGMEPVFAEKIVAYYRLIPKVDGKASALDELRPLADARLLDGSKLADIYVSLSCVLDQEDGERVIAIVQGGGKKPIAFSKQFASFEPRPVAPVVESAPTHVNGAARPE